MIYFWTYLLTLVKLLMMEFLRDFNYFDWKGEMILWSKDCDWWFFQKLCVSSRLWDLFDFLSLLLLPSDITLLPFSLSECSWANQLPSSNSLLQRPTHLISLEIQWFWLLLPRSLTFENRSSLRALVFVRIESRWGHLCFCQSSSQIHT